MYRYSNGQISLADFKQPVGMNLKESNRWVKKAQTIPWLEIEKRYAALFTNRKGNVAKPLRLALGACIIQAEYGYSDEETVLQIQENPYLQYFCGYPGYDDEKLPFDPSLMVYFRKRLTPEVLGEINEMIVRDAKERQAQENEFKDDDDSDDHPGAGGNSGTMIVDATCAPSNIRYPQDVSLLNEARENAEKLLDVLHDPADGKKPRTYRKRARKDYLKYTRCRKHMKFFQNICLFISKHKHIFYLVFVSALFICSLFYLSSLSDADVLSRQRVPTIIICIGLFLSICKTIYKILKDRKR